MFLTVDSRISFMEFVNPDIIFGFNCNFKSK